MAIERLPDWVIQKLTEGVGNYYDDKPARAMCLAMFETADGCIRFAEQVLAPPTMEIAIAARWNGPGPGINSGPDKSDPFDQIHTKVFKRQYELYDRCGPGGMILHYKEVVV